MEDALEHTAGDKELLRDIIRFSIKEIPPILAEIEKNRIKNDLKKIRNAAHQIKGMAGAIGAQSLYLAAMEIETLSQSDGILNALPFAHLQDTFDVFQNHVHIKKMLSLDSDNPASLG